MFAASRQMYETVTVQYVVYNLVSSRNPYIISFVFYPFHRESK